ncbi:MAG TPA: ATP-binding protein [Candidatus Tectomicrobia bacterium]|nr:ATP-binding protein [Candidatus Tectomicrobia bacterium]
MRDPPLSSSRTGCRHSDDNFLLGPHEVSQSMLARRLTTILPEMTLAQAIETTRIHPVAGRTGDRTAVVTTRPYRAPHHTISDVWLIGGGQVPLPGDVSRAHHGGLLLDELRACRRHVLEVLRQPLRTASDRYNLASVLDFAGLAVLVEQVHGGTG